MEDRGPQTDQAGGEQEHRVARCHGENQEADQAEPHARDQRVRLGMMIGIEPDQRLKQRRGELKGEGNEADLPEIQPESALEDRVHGGQQRLHHVVQQVTDADGEEDCVGGAPHRRMSG